MKKGIKIREPALGPGVAHQRKTRDKSELCLSIFKEKWQNTETKPSQMRKGYLVGRRCCYFKTKPAVMRMPSAQQWNLYFPDESTFLIESIEPHQLELEKGSRPCDDGQKLGDGQKLASGIPIVPGRRIGLLSCPFFRRTAGVQYSAFSTEDGGTALQGAEKTPFLCTRSGRLSRRCASPCPPRANHWSTSHLTCNTVRTIVSHLAALKPRPALAERERRPPTQAVLGGSRPGPRGSPLSTVDRAQIHGGQGPIGGPRPSLPGPPRCRTGPSSSSIATLYPRPSRATYRLHPQQQAIVNRIYNAVKGYETQDRLFLVEGGPGTGKTAMIRALVASCDGIYINV